MAEEAKSISWLKVFGGMGLGRVLGKAKSRVEVGTKWGCSKFIKGCGCVFMDEETGGQKRQMSLAHLSDANCYPAHLQKNLFKCPHTVANFPSASTGKENK